MYYTIHNSVLKPHVVECCTSHGGMFYIFIVYLTALSATQTM
jgi:hypothetical protein